MANYAFTNIEFSATKSEKKEIDNFFKTHAIPWNYGITGETFNITSKWVSDIDNYLPRLSRLFPTVIFKYSISYEECFEEGVTEDAPIFMVNGNKIDCLDIKTSRYLAYQEYMDRFYKNNNIKSEGITHEVEIMPNGLVAAYGNNFVGECNIYDWENIIKVSCGNFHTVGLKKDGTVLAAGANTNFECNFSDITDKVIDISCGRYHTALLLSTGKVIVKGNLEFESEMPEGQEEFSDVVMTKLILNQSKSTEEMNELLSSINIGDPLQLCLDSVVTKNTPEFKNIIVYNKENKKLGWINYEIGSRWDYLKDNLSNKKVIVEEVTSLPKRKNGTKYITMKLKLLHENKINTLEKIGEYKNTSVESWPPIEKMVSIFDAIIGVTADKKLYIDGFCPCTNEEIRKIMGI